MKPLLSATPAATWRKLDELLATGWSVVINEMEGAWTIDEGTGEHGVRPPTQAWHCHLHFKAVEFGEAKLRHIGSSGVAILRCDENRYSIHEWAHTPFAAIHAAIAKAEALVTPLT